MPNTKISADTSAGALTGAEIIPLVRSTVNYRSTTMEAGAVAAGTLALSEFVTTTFPAGIKAISARAYQDVAGEREIVQLVRVTGTPSPVKAGHVVDAGGTYWRINSRVAKPQFFADMNGAAAAIRTAFQSALDMAAAFPGMTGGRVEFCDGTFDMTDVILTLSSGLTISARSGYCTLQRSINVGAAGYDGARPPMMSGTSLTNVKISGIKFQYTAGATTVPATNSSQFSPLFFTACSYVSVTDCLLSGAFYMGIVFNACTNVKAKRNEIDGIVNRGIYASTSCDVFDFSDNAINGYQIGTTTAYTAYGINFLHVTAGGFSNGRVCRNSISHCASDAVVLAGRVQGIICSENTVNGSATHGILMEDVAAVNPIDLVISGNIVSACLGVAIYALNSSYVLITGNSVRTSDAGITLEGGGNHVVIGNSSRNNVAYGIKMNNSAHNAVNTNQTATNGSVGIGEIGTSAANMVHDNLSVADTAAVGAPGVGSSYVGNVVF